MNRKVGIGSGQGRAMSPKRSVKLEDGVLMFGARPADNNMCAPDKRPTAMSGMALERQ